jgi:hypothetical protein
MEFEYDIDNLIYNACTSGNLIEFNRLRAENIPFNTRNHFVYACGGGNQQIINIFLDEYKIINYDRGMCKASLKGHMSIVKQMLSLGATNYLKGFESACIGEQFHIADLFLTTYGPFKIYNALHWSITLGHRSVTNYLLNYGKKYNNWKDLINVNDVETNSMRLITDYTNINIEYNYDKQLDFGMIEYMKIHIEHGDIIHKNILKYPRDKNLIIDLLEIGLNKSYLCDIGNFDSLLLDIGKFKRYTICCLSNILGNNLLNIILEYGLL